MDKVRALRLVREAKHSLALIISFLGHSNPIVNGLAIKWPDVLDAYLADDEVNFLADMSTLICLPVKVLAEALCERAGSKFLEEIAEISKDVVDPIDAKRDLIRICNLQVSKLRKAGFTIEDIKGID